MSLTTRQVEFFNSEQGKRARMMLEKMTENTSFITKSSYSANTAKYPDNTVPFVEKHMTYLSLHRDLDPEHYIANLRLMTRKN